MSFAKKVVNRLCKKKFKISIAESCTGGLNSSSITSIAGSSKVFKIGLITYSNESKIRLLKVSKKKIFKYGAVSKEVCLDMLKNVANIGKTNFAISITGIAGPGGGSIKKPVGLVFIVIKKKKKLTVKKFIFKNKGRLYVQKKALNKSLNLIFDILK